MNFHRVKQLHGELTIPGDKSISHRSVMFGSIAKGITEIQGFLPGADCISTINCFRKMGITIEQDHSSVIVHGNGLHGLTKPDSILDCGNSGTTTRLCAKLFCNPNWRFLDSETPNGSYYRSTLPNGR